MPRTAVAFAAACIALALALAGGARAQDEAEPRPSAEQMIEVAREAYRPPGLLQERCPEGAPGEIVVCAPVNGDAYRVTSPTDEAIAAGKPADDGVPRAPDLAPPPCDPTYFGCMKFGQPPPMPPMVDYDKIPTPLTPEEAALVFRADSPPEP